MCNSQENFPNYEIDKCKISESEVVLGAPDRVNIPCPMHDSLPCQFDVKISSATVWKDNGRK